MIVDRISREAGVSSELLRLIIRSASSRYRTYRIAKRTGGTREVSQPTPELKFLQRWVVRNVISQLPVAKPVMAYRLGIGIAQNAAAHAANNYLLKLDFESFFPSIKGSDVRRLIQLSMAAGHLGDLSADDVEDVVKIVCRDGALTIGAPSSPAISNAVLFQFDLAMLTECEATGVTYTRYADDLAFSTNEPGVLSGLYDFIQRTLDNSLSPRLTINPQKTIFTSRKHKRSVTGLVLTSDRKISIGRDKKKHIKSLIFQQQQGKLSAEQLSYLTGYLSYVRSVDPSFVDSLRKKYGTLLLEQVLTQTPVRRKSL